MKPPATRALRLVLPALLALTLAAYLPTAKNGFVDYDDYSYVIDNPAVNTGLSWAGIRWAFSSFWSSNWHPLTWISHMADVQAFGLEAGGPHLVSLLFHAANTLLLLLVFLRATGALWPSALTAALFGVHPLHVESVAWISERKDVLSGLFWMLALGAYTRYARRPGVPRYLEVAALFGLGLMAKPMVITLPFVLILLDYWPLGRLRLRREQPGASSPRPPLSLARCLLEKTPLLALSLGSGLVTYLAQERSHSLELMAKLSLGYRAANAMVAYAQYLGQTVVPRNLACLYPHSLPTIPPWQVGGAVLLLAGLTALALRLSPRHGYAGVGWLWYLGTLLPVSGLVQVGFQARADRYTYLPLIGIFLALSFGAGEALGRVRRGRLAVAIAAAAGLVLLAGLSFRQTRHWEGSIPLFEHAVAAAPGNWMALYSLGKGLVDAGRVEEGISVLQEALRLNPTSGDSTMILGKAYAKIGRYEEALEAYNRTVALKPAFGEAYSDLGFVLGRLGRRAEQELAYREAIRLSPALPFPYYNLGLSYAARGDREAALVQYRSLRRIDAKRAEQLRRMIGSLAP